MLGWTIQFIQTKVHVHVLLYMQLMEFWIWKDSANQAWRWVILEPHSSLLGICGTMQLNV